MKSFPKLGHSRWTTCQRIAVYSVIGLATSSVLAVPRHEEIEPSGQSWDSTSALARQYSLGSTQLQERSAQVLDAAPNLSADLLNCSGAGFLTGTVPGSAQTPRPSTGGATPCTQRVTISSTPCGAKLYIDNIEAGRTPITFPMPLGRYFLVILAPGHQRFAQRILVSDAPLEIRANLIPER
jgi:PEGA domain-containing protein